MSEKRHRVAWIAGATGLVGSHLLQELLHGNDFDEVWALGRRSCDIYHPKLKEWLLWAEDSPGEEPGRVDDIFCCTGSTMKKAGSKAEFYAIDHDLPLQLARLGKKKLAKSFYLISSLGADKNSVFFYNRVKGELERDLELLAYDRLAIFRPSILAGPRHEKRFGEKLGLSLMRMLAPIIPGSDRFRPTDSEILAKAMLETSRQDFKGIKVIEAKEIPSLVEVS